MSSLAVRSNWWHIALIDKVAVHWCWADDRPGQDVVSQSPYRFARQSLQDFVSMCELVGGEPLDEQNGDANEVEERAGGSVRCLLFFHFVASAAFSVV